MNELFGGKVIETFLVGMAYQTTERDDDDDGEMRYIKSSISQNETYVR